MDLNFYVKEFLLRFIKTENLGKITTLSKQWYYDSFNFTGEFPSHEYLKRVWKILDFNVGSNRTSRILRKKVVARYTEKLKGGQDIRLEDFLCFLKNSLCLKELNLEGCDWVNNSTLKELLRHHGKLEVLVLDAANLNDEDFQDIAKFSKLKILCIHSCEKLTDKFLGYIKCLRNLTLLRLRGGGNFTEVGLAALFEFGSLQKLVEVDLAHCTKFDDNCVNRMIQCCGATLETFHIYNPMAITESGFATLFRNCSKLVNVHRIQPNIVVP